MLLSDQGKEFCNQILEKLKNNVGFEHIVTSAYNPRTNGMTERLNQTIIESLRKHSENNPEEWPKHLNFVLMAYRTRVHSVTNYTPFELMFGRKMNQFENWTSSNEDEVSAILNRTQEIKEMFENTHSSALANIKKNQEKQIIIQNKAHNTESEKIPIGTTVYLKCEGLLSKLEPRFKGPYKITGHTSRGNYKVQDALGNAIPESFPRQKIKVVIDNELLPEQSLEIEKIIKHKIVDNNWFYLVKWADMPAKESSWIPESHFNSKLIINKYKETLGNQIQLRQRKPRKINMVSNLVILLLWCLFVPICTHPPNATIKNTTSKSTPTMSVTTKKSVKQTSYSKSTEKMNNPVDDLIKGFATINSTFKACTKDLEKNLVNINTMCVEQRNHDNSSLEIYLEEAFMPITKAQEIRFPMYILGKMHYEVYGSGLQCTMKRHILKTSMNFLGMKYESFKTENIKLTYDECYIMNKSRPCRGKEMECDADFCTHSSNPEPTYIWLSEAVNETFSCTVTRKLVAAKHSHDNVFSPYCIASDKRCQMHDSIIIWDESIFHNCPLYHISRETFVADLVSKNPNMLLAHPKMAFQVTTSEQLCGLKTVQTTEGVYLSLFTNDKINKKPPENIDINEIKELLLSDIDFESHSHAVDHRFLLHQDCNTLKTILQSFAITNKEDFLTYTMPDGDTTVFYSYMKNIYTANCKNIYSLTIVNSNRAKEEMCYEYLPIMYAINEEKKSGFLTPEGLIIDSSNQIKCDALTQYIQIPNTTKTVIRKKENSLLVDDKYINFVNFHFISNNVEYENYTHNSILSENIDIIFSMHEILNNEINAG